MFLYERWKRFFTQLLSSRPAGASLIGSLPATIECNTRKQLSTSVKHHKKIFQRLAACVILLSFAGTSLLIALDPNKTITQYGHNVWYRHNGLPANAVTVGLQAYDGYLWLGTSAGLFRFDGVNFSQVITNPTDSRIIESVSAMCLSKDSSIWVGTEYSGLRRVQRGKVILYGPNDGIEEMQVRALLESRSGRLWVGTSYGLYTYTGEKFSTVPIQPNYITGIAEDRHGRIWVGTHDGIRIFNDSDGKQVDSITTAKGLPHDITMSIYADRDGNVWIGTGDGLARWKNGAMNTYKWTDGLADNRITCIREDRDNNVWFGTYKGISRLSRGIWSSMSTIEGLTNNHILSIIEDHEGSLWVGTLEGLNRFKDVNITTYTTKEGLAADNLSGIAETPDGSLFFLSDVNGSISQLKNGKFTHYSSIVGPAYVARNGSLWIGQRGLLLNIHNGKIKRYDSATGFPSAWISAITEDDVSLILFVDGGPAVRRFIDGKIKPYLLNGKPYPSQEYVVCFYSKPGGELWIGTSHGLVQVKDGKSTEFLAKDGLAGEWVSSICDDGRGNIWISSPRDGLTRYNNGKFTAYNIDNGLFTNEIYCVLADDRGDIWLSSPRGIGSIKRQNFDELDAGRIAVLHTQVYGTTDGMKSDDCFGGWQPAGWKARNGNLWFATKKGAVMIDPGAFKLNRLSPPVLLEQIIADQQNISLSQTISLQPGTEKLEFHYTALSFLVPERVLFKYTLEGFDRNWVEAKNRRVAYYTNLPPGEYRFRVMACNNDGVWNEAGSSVLFTLRPDYYQTWWFFLLMAIVAAGITFGIYRLRVWRLLKREKELQAGIDEAVANIKVLGGLIPICANCKKIRDDEGYWDHLERYIQEHSEAKFSHGICPECMVKLYPHFRMKKETR